jgi:hypothetical protein
MSNALQRPVSAPNPRAARRLAQSLSVASNWDSRNPDKPEPNRFDLVLNSIASYHQAAPAKREGQQTKLTASRSHTITGERQRDIVLTSLFFDSLAHRSHQGAPFLNWGRGGFYSPAENLVSYGTQNVP